MNILKKIFGDKREDLSNVTSSSYKMASDRWQKEAMRWKNEAERWSREALLLRKEVSGLKALGMKKNSQANTSAKPYYPVIADKGTEIELQNKTSYNNKKHSSFKDFNPASQDKKESEFIPQEKKTNVENKDVEANLEKLQAEATSMQALYNKIGEEMADLRKGIDRMKISLSTCQKQYKDNYQIPQVPKKPVIMDSEEEDIEDAETTAPPTIIPKPLTIKGYEDFYKVIERNLSSLSFSRDKEKDKRDYAYYINFELSNPLNSKIYIAL